MGFVSPGPIPADVGDMAHALDFMQGSALIPPALTITFQYKPRGHILRPSWGFCHFMASPSIKRFVAVHARAARGDAFDVHDIQVFAYGQRGELRRSLITAIAFAAEIYPRKVAQRLRTHAGNGELVYPHVVHLVDTSHLEYRRLKKFGEAVRAFTGSFEGREDLSITLFEANAVAGNLVMLLNNKELP